MKKSMIIGKRQMVLAGLVFALAIAVWLNMNYAAKEGGFDLTAESASSKYLGEAEYVGASVEGEAVSSEEAVAVAALPDSMKKAKNERADTRKEAIELLEDTVNDAKASGADVETALAKISEISDRMDKEASIETLLSAKGYSAIAVIGDAGTTVTVSAGELQQYQTVQIQDAVTSVTGQSLENIKIITVK